MKVEAVSVVNNIAFQNKFEKENMETSFDSMMTSFLQLKEEFGEKIIRGEMEPSFDIGAQSLTNREWDAMLNRFDKQEEAIQKKIKEDIEERIEDELSDKEFSELIGNKSKPLDRGAAKFPYSYLAEDGMITYKGVTFFCDEMTNSLYLGDCSNDKDCITVYLERGGRLVVNRENLEELSQAISMFSPEDIRRILCAIADDKKIQATQKEIDDATNSIGAEQDEE